MNPKFFSFENLTQKKPRLVRCNLRYIYMYMCVCTFTYACVCCFKPGFATNLLFSLYLSSWVLAKITHQFSKKSLYSVIWTTLEYIMKLKVCILFISRFESFIHFGFEFIKSSIFSLLICDYIENIKQSFKNVKP